LRDLCGPVLPPLGPGFQLTRVKPHEIPDLDIRQRISGSRMLFSSDAALICKIRLGWRLFFR